MPWLMLTDASPQHQEPRRRGDGEAAVTAFALEQPAFSQVRVSHELRKREIFISPSCIRSVWLRQNLESFKKPLSALEKHIAETGVVLTEAQVQALKKKQEDDVAHGEIETAHPGYLGSQDIFYVGTIKSVGRIYQQTFVDTYSKWAATKLYTTKTPITAADLLNDRVATVLRRAEHGGIHILTDRGTEYCGKPENHDYRLYLALKGVLPGGIPAQDLPVH
ncbi:integrase-like protein [Nitrosomonas ureae]|nr:integrase-like protein [Nitrosomonas ureae]